ncbi:MAG TPA: prolipoprotein diacylglyceryl transferase family protein [Anaerolineales bacterium]|nr:prolipoprotein diacylglyceryl transferase family protein [Anaerolineales bacterium]
MLPILQIGPLAIQTPGLILLLGLWLALTISERAAARNGLDASQLYNLVLIALVAGLMGARLGYVLRYPQAFAESPASILSLNPGLLELWGGAAGAVLAALIYGQRKGLPAWPTLDALAPGMAVLGVALGFSHLASGAAFGAPTSLPWGIELWGAARHPSQVYEIIAAALILGVVWPGQKISGQLNAAAPGLTFWVFSALSALSRLILEAWRGDSEIILGSLRQPQLIAWLVLALSLWAIGRIFTQSRSTIQTMEG